jgi:GNAT superfamily N-acetyltransferase
MAASSSIKYEFDFGSLTPWHKRRVARELRAAFYSRLARDADVVLDQIESMVRERSSTVLTMWTRDGDDSSADLMGVAVLTPDRAVGSKVLHASDVVVSGSWRRRGVARALAIASIGHAARNGVREVRARFDADAPAWQLDFYSALGFLKSNDSTNEYSLFVPLGALPPSHPA